MQQTTTEAEKLRHKRQSVTRRHNGKENKHTPGAKNYQRVMNTPVAFGRMQRGWSQPGQAPGTAGGRHTQTACLTGAWPGLEQGPPLGLG